MSQEVIDLVTLVVAVFAAFGAIATALITGLLLRNDNRRMKRKAPVLELHGGWGERSRVRGWDERTFVVRNLEPVAINVIGVRIRRFKRGSVCSVIDAAGGRYNGFGEWQVPETLEARRRTYWQITVQPVGTPRGQTSRGDVFQECVFVQGITSARDLVLEWEWADSHR